MPSTDSTTMLEGRWSPYHTWIGELNFSFVIISYQVVSLSPSLLFLSPLFLSLSHTHTHTHTHTHMYSNRTLYLLGYIPRDNRVYLGDKELNVVSYSLQLSVLEYQTAIMRKDFDTADKVELLSIMNTWSRLQM